MRKLFLFCVFILSLNAIQPHLIDASSVGSVDGMLNNWSKSYVLAPTEKKSARTAVLIISPPRIGNSLNESRWKLGKKMWEQHMNSHPNVDCYFVQSTNRKLGETGSDQVWIEGNTIYVGDWWYDRYKSDRILHKTIVAMEALLPHYTHFVRTNLNTFLNLKNVNEYMETHHQSFYSAPVWQTAWYAIGYGIVCTADVAEHMTSEYRRLEKMGEELISPAHADDCALISLATGVWPYDEIHPFRCCPSLPCGVRQLMSEDSFSATRLARYGALLLPPISLSQAMHFCKYAKDTVMLYRIREGLSLGELAQLYGHLLQKCYPTLPCIDLEEYVESLSVNL